MRDQLRLTHRQVNILLEVLVATALVSGLVSWMVPLSAARPVTFVHAVAGLLIVVVSPLKIRGSALTGFRRRRRTRWLSAAFGVLVLATIVLGVVHSVALWFGIGFWSSLWTHQLFGFVIIPLMLWHVVSRPVRPKATDFDRRGLITAGAAAAVTVGVVAGQDITLRIARLAGGNRAGTGSHEAGSFDPSQMPSVQWINDTAPHDTGATTWKLKVAGQSISIDQLRASASPVTARLDCTGGWYADQNWDAVALGALLPEGVVGRSLRITSSTGYGRLFPLADADQIYLAVGYDGVPLRRGHGAPVRLIAPGLRGPQWIKWVTEVSLTDRPSWLQLPLPPT